MSIQVATPHMVSARTTGRGIIGALSSGSVAGLVEHPAQVARVLAALMSAGVDRESIEVVDAAGLRRSAGGPLSWLTSIGPEGGILRRYRAELEGGRVLLVVRDVGSGLRQRASAALRDAGGHAIYDFGRFTVRTVAP